MVYQKYILALIYVGTDLYPWSFSRPQGKAKGYYSIICVIWEKNKHGQKIWKISGFQLGYSKLSPLHPSGTKSELLGNKRSFMPPTIWPFETVIL